MQNQKHTAEELRIAFDRLPKKVRDTILSNHVDEVIRRISEKYHLHIDQGMVLENEITYVMYGLEKADMFVKNLMHSANIENEVASNIAKEVSTEIFNKIIAELILVTSLDYQPEPVSDEPETYKEMIRRTYREAEEKDDQKKMLEIKRSIDPDVLPGVSIEQLLENLYKKIVPKKKLSVQEEEKGNILNLRDTEDPRQITVRNESVPFVVTGKNRPSDGSEKIDPYVEPQDHPEEYLSFPYKKEDVEAKDETSVDFDLDQFEPVKKTEDISVFKTEENISSQSSSKSEVETKLEIQPKINNPAFGEISDKTPTESEIESLNTDVINEEEPDVVAPTKNARPVQFDPRGSVLEKKTEDGLEAEVKEEESILSKNMQRATIAKKEITEIDGLGKLPSVDLSDNFSSSTEGTSPDPYREQV